MTAVAARLFCLPYSGASAMVYARWRRALPAWLAVHPVELPGRGARASEPLSTDLRRLAASLAGEVGGLIDGPYALFGHSLGALLAFELAHALLDNGTLPPLVLFASGTEAPAVRDDRELARPRTDAELVADLRDYQGTPEEALADPELMAAVLPVLRADFLMAGTYVYRPRPALPCPVHVLAGTRDDVGRPALQAWGWETRGDFAIDLFDGDHFFIHSRQAEVLGVLDAALSRRMNGGPAVLVRTGGSPESAGRTLQ
ncbi:thioesterase II family protein [Inquilinus limosus]|uniref:thioesterase II family protein n=1 Tax=Inquilinus limosus TaxID=171674 RepID=UPI000413E6AD|nr:alpha/beta fold hydrolase [Inquilinus limosus]